MRAPPSARASLLVVLILVAQAIYSRADETEPSFRLSQLLKGERLSHSNGSSQVDERPHRCALLSGLLSIEK